LRADQIQSVNGGGDKEYLVPIVADAEAGLVEI
jgi:isocitrate lyase